MKSSHYPKLFTKGKIGNVVIKNRIVRNSMGTYLGNPNGTVTDRQIKAYAEAADGGAGLIFMDNATPVPMTSCGLRADKDEFIAGLSLLADALKEHGAVPAMQLAHPGRDAGFVGSADVIGASAITYEPWYQAGAKLPRALSVGEIHDLVHKFGDAALRCKRAGFEVLEIHGAAGCIPTNFLSPHDNQRTDMYGGSLENRMRFLLEIIRDVKQKCGPDFPVGVKLSTDDWEPDGIRLPETIKVCQELEREGVSHLNLMGGTHATASMEMLKPNAFNAGDTQKIKEAVHIPVFAGHNVFTPEIAEQLLEKNAGDFVALGRAFLADPAWAIMAQRNQAHDINPCINCLIGCMDRGLLANTPIHCTVNPTLYKYESNPYEPASVSKNIAVIGAGPAGCEAALVAASRGHQVTLYERRSFGGAMVEAAAPESKANIRRLTTYYEEHVTRSKNIKLEKKTATYADLVNQGYQAVIVAVGGAERKLDVPGINQDKVISAMDYLGGRQDVPGDDVVVIGGGVTGAETALELKAAGKQVTIVEMMDEFLASPAQSSLVYKIAIKQAQVKVLTGLRLQEVTTKGVKLVDRFGNVTTLPATAVVTAAGFVPQTSLADKLEEQTDMDIYNIGDSERVRQIYDAVHEGFVVARQL